MNEIEQVEENAATASRENPLTGKELNQVAELLSETKGLADLYCTGCGYCVPCPNDVNIPTCFNLMNVHRVYGLTEWAKERYQAIRPNHSNVELRGEKASQCQECGECEEKCPQNIAIMEQLKEVARVFEP